MEIIMNQISKHYTIDLSSVTDLWDFHDIIAEALDFPDYYGCNLDALWDCLREMIGDTYIKFINFDVMEKVEPEYTEKILKILRRFKHCYDDYYVHRITIEIVRGDRHEFIE